MIKEMREEMNLSREQLAITMKVSYETIKKWEKDDRIPEGPASILFKQLYDERILSKEVE